jgi:adenosylhomocysteine nucleosidase
MRVALLAPMRQELRPLVRKLRLERDPEVDARFVGRVGDVDVVASLTGIGTRAATRATETLLDSLTIDHVMVVGIAGGVDPAEPIGASIAPELVVDGESGSVFRPRPLGDRPSHGRLVTSDRLVTDPAEGQRLHREGVVGLDMETAAVAAVCESRGCPWSVSRAISDRVTDGTTDPAVLALAGADGSGDPRAVLRYLLTRPWRVIRLVRLARGTQRATEAAAEAAIRGLDRLSA